MKYHVLIVEDDKLLSSCIAEALTEYKKETSVSYTCDVTNTIAGCESLLEKQGYDIILLDLNLGNGKGEYTFSRIYSACNRNLGTPLECRMPIVILTGSTEDYSSLVLKGAMDVIFKPASIADIAQRLHMAILKFPYKRSNELHEEIKDALEILKQLPITGGGT